MGKLRHEVGERPRAGGRAVARPDVLLAAGRGRHAGEEDAVAGRHWKVPNALRADRFDPHRAAGGAVAGVHDDRAGLLADEEQLAAGDHEEAQRGAAGARQQVLYQDGPRFGAVASPQLATGRRGAAVEQHRVAQHGGAAVADRQVALGTTEPVGAAPCPVGDHQRSPRLLVGERPDRFGLAGREGEGVGRAQHAADEAGVLPRAGVEEQLGAGVAAVGDPCLRPQHIVVDREDRAVAEDDGPVDGRVAPFRAGGQVGDERGGLRPGRQGRRREQQGEQQLVAGETHRGAVDRHGETPQKAPVSATLARLPLGLV